MLAIDRIQIRNGNGYLCLLLYCVFGNVQRTDFFAALGGPGTIQHNVNGAVNAFWRGV
ncbi:hypothetical protein D3C75_439430 [compost metagenome]